MTRKFFGVVASIVTLAAAFIASSASYFWAYQPKEPKCLKK